MGAGPGGGSELDRLLREIGQWLKRTSKLLLVSLFLSFVGFLGGPLAGDSSFWFLFFLGLGLLAYWISQRYFPRLVGREEVTDRWEVFIAGGQARGEGLLKDARQLILASKAPDISMETPSVAPGIVRGLLGGTRPFLVISNGARPNLKPFRMYINARDYGNNLQVSWYLAHQPTFWQRLMGLLFLVPFLNLAILPFYLSSRLPRAREVGLLGLDLFDQQDLRACVTNAHHCLLKAVEKVMMGLEQDPSKIERKSRGFLGIS